MLFLYHYREIVPTPDGGELHLDWLHNENDTFKDSAKRPTVLILPGLTSKENSFLANPMKRLNESFKIIFICELYRLTQSCSYSLFPSLHLIRLCQLKSMLIVNERSFICFICTHIETK